MSDGATYTKTLDILPNLTSEVVIGELTLAEIEAFTIHEASFVDVFAGERYRDFNVLTYLGKVNELLARTLGPRRLRSQDVNESRKNPFPVP